MTKQTQDTDKTTNDRPRPAAGRAITPRPAAAPAIAQAPAASTPPAEPDDDDLDADLDDLDEDGDDTQSATAIGTAQASDASDGTAKGGDADKLSTNQAYRQRLRDMPQHRRQSTFISNIATRLTRIRRHMSGWGGNAPEAVARLDEAQEKLNAAMLVLNALPDNYRPRVGVARAPSVELHANDIVQISDKHRDEYDGMLDADQMVGIRVIEVRGSRVVCTLPAGDRAWFPRNHLQPTARAAA